MAAATDLPSLKWSHNPSKVGGTLSTTGLEPVPVPLVWGALQVIGRTPCSWKQVKVSATVKAKLGKEMQMGWGGECYLIV